MTVRRSGESEEEFRQRRDRDSGSSSATATNAATQAATTAAIVDSSPTYSAPACDPSPAPSVDCGGSF